MKKVMLFIWVVLFAVISPSSGGGQDAEDAPTTTPTRSRLTPAVALARLCISEANWECFESGDGLAIHEVILRGAARGGSYTGFARGYARRLFGARPHDVPRLRWVGQLTADCDRPEDWPTTATTRRDGVVTTHPHPGWERYRARCEAVMVRAAEVVATHTIETIDDWSTCMRPVHDWGGWMDRARAERIGLVAVDCGDTANDFYCRPSLDAGCMEVDPE